MAASTHAGRRFDKPVASSVIRERVRISARSSGSGRMSSMASAEVGAGGRRFDVDAVGADFDR